MNDFYLGLKSPGATPELLFGGRARLAVPTSMKSEMVQACPICDGHGGWWFSECRSLWCGCFQCNYSGYIEVGSCIHEWGKGRQIGRCLMVYTCVKCGTKKQIDSGD